MCRRALGCEWGGRHVTPAYSVRRVHTYGLYYSFIYTKHNETPRHTHTLTYYIDRVRKVTALVTDYTPHSGSAVCSASIPHSSFFFCVRGPAALVRYRMLL